MNWEPWVLAITGVLMLVALAGMVAGTVQFFEALP